MILFMSPLVHPSFHDLASQYVSHHQFLLHIYTDVYQIQDVGLFHMSPRHGGSLTAFPLVNDRMEYSETTPATLLRVLSPHRLLWNNPPHSRRAFGTLTSSHTRYAENPRRNRHNWEARSLQVKAEYDARYNPFLHLLYSYAG